MMNQTNKPFFIHYSTPGLIGKFLLERVNAQIDNGCRSGKQIGSWKEGLDCGFSIWNFDYIIKPDTLKSSFLDNNNSGIRFDEKCQNNSPVHNFSVNNKNQTKQRQRIPRMKPNIRPLIILSICL